VAYNFQSEDNQIKLLTEYEMLTQIYCDALLGNTPPLMYATIGLRMLFPVARQREAPMKSLSGNNVAGCLETRK
jgi:hypothetical protein